MNTVLIIVYAVLSIISFLVLFFLSSKQKTNYCKLEKISILAYSIILELVWLIIFNTILFFMSFSVLKLIFAASLSFVLTIVINEILGNIKYDYFCVKDTYKISTIIALEIIVLKIYPYFIRIKNLICRISKRTIYLIPVIIIELIAIFIFSLFIDIQHKEWEIFELILTTVIIVAFNDIYNSESSRRKNLKWQYKYYYFVEANMYDYIERILILIGMHPKCDYRVRPLFSNTSKVINELSVYCNSQHYKQFIIENQNDSEKIQKYIEDITETFIYTLKEQRNEIICIKQNEHNEDYLYYHCIEEVNKLKADILLSNIYDIGNAIQKRLPSIIQYCSSILSLVDSVWEEDRKYSDRIRSILEGTKKS